MTVTDMTAMERIAELVDPAYIESIPSFVRGHAQTASCRLIKRRYPKLFEAFSQDSKPDEQARAQMKEIVNNIYAKRLMRRNN